MGILSNSLNLLSKSISKFSPLSLSANFRSKNPFSSSLLMSSLVTLPTPFGQTQTSLHSVLRDIKSHNNKIKKLLVVRQHSGSTVYSRLSIDQNLPHNNDLYFTFSRDNQFFFPVASCNSLLLSYIDSDDHVALWNPTTDEIKSLPKPTVSGLPSEISTYISPYGFGYDRESQDYKVIRFVQPDRYKVDEHEGCTVPWTEYIVELYSLKTDSWKVIPYPDLGRPVQSYSIHINGFYYWLAAGPTDFILSFEFANEKFSSVPLPKTDTLSDDNLNIRFAEYDGSLALLVFGLDHDNLSIEKSPLVLEIWVWYKKSWSRVSGIIDHAPDVAVDMPLGLFNNDQLYLKGLKSGEVLVFDCSKRELKSFGLNSDPWHEVFILPYVESEEPIPALPEDQV
ncbi:hypothetical protein OROGR_010058 [Orobanche gracilis]